MNVRTWLRLGILFVMGGAVVAYFALGLHRNIQADALLEHRESLLLFIEERPLLGAVSFFALYVLIVAFSLPAAALFSLAGGMLFGRTLGTLLVLFAATCGAMFAFLGARFVLGEWVQRRFRGRVLSAVNEGVDQGGLSFILFLRFVPLFPFFLVTLAAGISRIPLRTFFLGTLVGIAPGTFVYVNAGWAFAQLDSWQDVFSLKFLGAMSLLGLFALLPALWKLRRGHAGDSPKRSA